MTHPCECDLTDDHGEAAELRRRLEARGWTEAARDMLATWDSWFAGQNRARRAEAHRLITAASFAAQAYDDALAGLAPDGAPGVMMRTFLLALVDPASTDLDSLRACNRPPAALTAQPVAQEPVAWQRLSAHGWLDVGTDDINHYRNMGQQIRPLYAHPATPAQVEAGLRLALDLAMQRYNSNGEGFSIVEAIRSALRAQSAPVGGEAQR